MRPPVRPFVFGLLLTALLACGCRSFPGHPVRLSAPRLPDDAVPASETPHPQLAAPAGEAAVARLFLGLEGVRARVEALRAVPLPAGQAPHMTSLPQVARSVKARFRRGGYGGPVRHVVVLGVTGRVPIPPAAMADLVLDPEVERQVLAAATFRRTATDFVLPGMRRDQHRVELLGVGIGPIRFNLRFNVVSERRDLADGRIWVRHDPAEVPRNERVTLYRGAALIEPLPDGGARMTEVLILGTSIDVAPMFLPPLLNMARSTLENRATNLWKRAWMR